MSSKSTRKKRTSNKKKIGEDCVKDNECFTNYCYNNKCTSKTRSYEIIEKLNKQLKEHYNDLRIMKQEKENLEELLDNDDNTIEENVKFIDDFERINRIIKEINTQIKDVQEQLKDDSSSKKSLNILSSRRDAKKKKTYECLFCLGEIDDINDSFRCPAKCDNGYFHLDCVQKFCESTKTVETYNYNPGANDEFSHQKYQIKAQCPSCFTDWTRVCIQVSSSPPQQNRSRTPSVQSNSSYESIFGMDDIDDDVSETSSVREIRNILGETSINENEDELESYRRNRDSPLWSGIPPDDPRNNIFHDNQETRNVPYSSTLPLLPPVTPPRLQEEPGPHDDNDDFLYLKNYSIRLIIGLEKLLDDVLKSSRPESLNYDYLMKNVQIRSTNKYDLFLLHENIKNVIDNVTFSLDEYKHIFDIYESNIKRLFNDKHPGFATRLGRENPVVDMWWNLLYIKKYFYDKIQESQNSREVINNYIATSNRGGKRKTKKRKTNRRRKILSGSKKKRGKR